MRGLHHEGNSKNQIEIAQVTLASLTLTFRVVMSLICYPYHGVWVVAADGVVEYGGVVAADGVVEYGGVVAVEGAVEYGGVVAAEGAVADGVVSDRVVASGYIHI